MDSRCPRRLTSYPTSACYLAVLRLKQLRAADKELTETEESKLSGCDWAINCQSAEYCFFTYCDTIADGKISDIEIAAMLNVSTETVRKVERDAIAEMRQTDLVLEIKEVYGEDKILDDAIDESINEIPRSK